MALDERDGWSPVPLWVLVVFVGVFTGWIVMPPVGALAGVLCITVARAAHRRRTAADTEEARR